MDNGVKPHEMTKFAVVTDSRVSYPARSEPAGDSSVGQAELFEG